MVKNTEKIQSVKSLSKEIVLVRWQDITPDVIRRTKHHFDITWDEMSIALNYDRRANAILRAVREPEKYLTDKLKRKFFEGFAKLERVHGNYHVVTYINSIKIPKHIRICALPPLCKGHLEPTFELPESGFCSPECKELFEKRQKRKRK